MKHQHKMSLVISFLTLSILFSSCSSDDSPTGGDNDLVDHGGIIAYTYQPLQGGVHQIYTINADGTGNQKIIESTMGLNHLDWSPDGIRITCVGYIGGGNNTWSIHVFNSDGTGLRRLTEANLVGDNEPRWSPDGSRIAFTRLFLSDNFREEIIMMNSDGTNQYDIGIAGSLGGWSPDGTRLIYTANLNENYEIFTCNPDGTEIEQVTHSTENENFAMYSLDGSQIVCSIFEGELYNNSNNASTFEIVVMNSDGTNRRQLTNNSSFDGSPRWSPDGTQLVFGSDRHQTGKWEVYVMNIDGSNVRRVTHLPENITGINPAWKLSE